jgi:hypothetical protein
MAKVTECWNAFESRYLSFRQLIAKRLLENDLSSIIRTVASHKRNKVSAGAPQYRSLWKIADQKVDSFCAAYRADRGEIEAQIPALKELHDLAQMPNTPKRESRLPEALSPASWCSSYLALPPASSSGCFTWA